MRVAEEELRARMQIFAIWLLAYKIEPFNCHSRREMYKNKLYRK